MPDPQAARRPHLRLMVLSQTGQDVRKCARCSVCADNRRPGDDLSLEMVIQLVLLNDEEVLTSRTVWSDASVAAAAHDCVGTLDLAAVLLALRAEAAARGLAPPEADRGES